MLTWPRHAICAARRRFAAKWARGRQRYACNVRNIKLDATSLLSVSSACQSDQLGELSGCSVGGRIRGLLQHILIHPRDKRVEELEKRLKWMEEQLKRVVNVQQSETDVESRNEPMGLETPSSDGPQAGTYSVQNMHEDGSFDSGYRMAEVSPQGSDFGVPSQNSKFLFHVRLP